MSIVDVPSDVMIRPNVWVKYRVLNVIIGAVLDDIQVELVNWFQLFAVTIEYVLGPEYGYMWIAEMGGELGNLHSKEKELGRPTDKESVFTS
jgi:hypothetical protein